MKHYRCIIGFILLLVTFISACDSVENNKLEDVKETASRIPYYSTIDETIEEGLKSEASELVSSYEINNEKIILFRDGARFGHASIAEDENGFYWYRSSAITRLDKEVSPTNVSMTRQDETERGTKYSVILGSVTEEDVSIAVVKVDGNIMNLSIDESRHYYYVTEPVDQVSIIEFK